MKSGVKKVLPTSEQMGNMGMKKMAGGGLAAGHKQADGIASKGKTKAKQVKMMMGGKAC